MSGTCKLNFVTPCPFLTYQYGTLIQCGYFSYVTTDDKEDEMFKKIRHADAVDGMVEGIDF